MKILLLYVHDFWSKPFRKAGSTTGAEDDAPDPDAPPEMAPGAGVLALIHAEPSDADDRGRVVTNAIKNVKWIAGKFGNKRAVLHPFAHLAKVSASPELAAELIEAMRQRLATAGYEVAVTPFGYFNEMKLHVAGESIAKVFVEI